MGLRYTQHFSTKKTPQNQPIPNTNQVENNAGGFVWVINRWDQLDRFLILGTEGGTYYTTEQKLTQENATNTLACINEDGKRAVNRIVQVSDQGLAPKNDPAIFALALAVSFGNDATKQLACDSLGKVCRIGTHLFHFLEYVEQFRGWGRMLRTAVADWYIKKTPADLAYQAVKYQQRDGWSHQDALRLAHPKPMNAEQNAVFRYIAKNEVGEVPAIIKGWEQAKVCTNKKEMIGLIQNYRLPLECVPTQFKTDAAVWDALLHNGLKLEAMVRSLGVMSKVGLLDPLSDAVKTVVNRLSDEKEIKQSRLHPITLLFGLKTYASGRGFKGSSTWVPNRAVCDALDDVFYLAFDNVEPTGKNLYLAVDISASMTWPSSHIAGTNITARAAAAALVLVTARVEKNCHIAAFSTNMRELEIGPKMRLDDVEQYMDRLQAGGTDCSVPMLDALQRGLKVDGFQIYTDNETWAGRMHPSQALREYRKAYKKPSKLAVVGMTATGFSIADPTDPGMMDFVGFSTNTPSAISSFMKSEF